MIGTTLSNYQVKREIGRGGFAAVYETLDTRSNRIVALKVLAPHLTWDEGFVTRFEREAKTMAGLRHPNIVAIHEVGEADGKHYIAMDYLEGRTLKQLIDKEGALPLERAIHIIQQLASALDYAHERGVVHRDIKPSNIIIGPDDHVTLTDFGIVKATEGTRLTSTGVTLGTPEYMSPEQGQGLDVDRHTDIYSLGVVLYEMLTGKVPFSGTTPLAVLHQHVYETPTALHALNPHLPRWVEAVVGKALAKEPSGRYSTTGEMATAVSEGEKLVPTVAVPTIGDLTIKRRTLPIHLWAPALAAVLVILAISATAVLKDHFATAISEPTTIPLAALASQTPTETAVPSPSPTQAETSPTIATPTAEPSPTPTTSPTPVPTPTAVPPPTPTLPAWPLVQEDNLDNPSVDFPESSDEHYRRFYRDGRYGIESNWGPSAFAWQSRGSFSDFMAEVDVTPQKEAGLAGLIFRRNGQQFYFFGISQGERYGFARRMGQGGENWYQIIPWLESPYISPAPGTNHLRVVCQGSQIALYINDQFVDSMQDAAFSQGQVGVLAGTHGEDYALSFFDNLRVYASATAHAQTSPTTAGEPTPSMPTWPLALADGFEGPNSGFGEANLDGIRRFYQEGVYVIESSHPDWLLWTSVGSFADFSLEVDVISQGETGYGGLVFRRQAEEQFYKYRVDTKGRYSLRKKMGPGLEGWEWILDWRWSPNVRPGAATNHLAVVCRGPEISLYVNGQWLDTVTDHSFSEGGVGLVAGTYMKESHAVFYFDDLEVHAPQA